MGFNTTNKRMQQTSKLMKALALIGSVINDVPREALKAVIALGNGTPQMSTKGGTRFCPSVWYSHRSRTFAKNRRKEIKAARKRRGRK